MKCSFSIEIQIGWGFCAFAEAMAKAFGYFLTSCKKYVPSA
jgi:hypothetical protein